jgi:hypothetical protein
MISLLTLYGEAKNLFASTAGDMASLCKKLEMRNSLAFSLKKSI